MKANCWYGPRDLRIEDVPDPTIINRRDVVVKITSSAICGSDLHLYNGFIPTMLQGDIMGHEFMGEVVEVGPGVKDLKVGDRVLIPFCIACGDCWTCKQGLTSLCENSNPNATVAEKFMGHSTGGLFGYSQMTGGYAGGQSQYVRVPFADFNCFKVPEGVPDEKVLFLTDIFPTGYMAAEACDIEPGDTVAVWGCGPVGLFAIKSAYMLGAERVIGIDRVPDRLRMAREQCGADTIDYEEYDVPSLLNEITGGRGPDKCIDAVGLEAHAPGPWYAYDRAKQMLGTAFDRPLALREAMVTCRNGGTVSVPGVYGGYLDKIPFGSVMNRSITIKTGQTHVHRYVKPLMERILKDEIDTTFLITHRISIDDVPEMFQTFVNKADDCVKVVIRPNA